MFPCRSLWGRRRLLYFFRGNLFPQERTLNNINLAAEWRLSAQEAFHRPLTLQSVSEIDPAWVLAECFGDDLLVLFSAGGRGSFHGKSRIWIWTSEESPPFEGQRRCTKLMMAGCEARGYRMRISTYKSAKGTGHTSL